MPTFLRRMTPEERAERDAKLRGDEWVREVRGSGRAMARMLHDDLHEQQQQLIEKRAALRSHPAYAYLGWAGRTNTVYDRAAWHRGRLVARFPRNAEERRQTVSWAEILDREAQELGTTRDELIAGAERINRQMHDLRREALELRNARIKLKDVSRHLRSKDVEYVERLLFALR